MLRLISSISLLLLIAPPIGIAQTELSPDKEDIPAKPKIYSPYAERAEHMPSFAEGVFWGDTHLHTRFSSDSGMIGNLLGPDDAYAFAKGEQVTSCTGQPAKLIRPLDFLVVSDHAEALGLAPYIAEANPDLLATENGKRWYDMVNAGEGYEAFREWGASMFTGDPIGSRKMQINVWEQQTEAADRHNDPGVFTALIGYEWTSLNTEETPSNLHRVVVFKDDADKANRIVPFSAYDSQDPEDLWAWMQAYEDETGGSVLAIPHNGNLSNGLMFATERLNGEPLTKEYAETRMRWEPIYEVTQIKGDGETHPALSTTDEFADYGTWDKGDIAGVKPKTPEMLPHEYARSALQLGLQQEAELGTNPYKFGMVGSTDTHTALAAAAEENYIGKHAGTEPSPDRIDHPMAKFAGRQYEGWSMSSSGYAAVWATGNTRKELWDAMARKEVYATAGPRMTVRFFGGWKYTEADVATRLPAEAGYFKGVSMGGTLSAAPDGTEAPTFIVGALRDPMSGNLDRIQIIKGWLNADGSTGERVYDVIWSDMDDRPVGNDGKVPTVGNTVDVTTATWTNSIGEPELPAVWQDPDFDVSLSAFYYARVIEIPTPRWTAYDALRFGLEVGSEVPMTIQERAYTSPIWFAPEG